MSPVNVGLAANRCLGDGGGKDAQPGIRGVELLLALLEPSALMLYETYRNTKSDVAMC